MGRGAIDSRAAGRLTGAVELPTKASCILSQQQPLQSQQPQHRTRSTARARDARTRHHAALDWFVVHRSREPACDATRSAPRGPAHPAYRRPVRYVAHASIEHVRVLPPADPDTKECEMNLDYADDDAHVDLVATATGMSYRVPQTSSTSSRSSAARARALAARGQGEVLLDFRGQYGGGGGGGGGGARSAAASQSQHSQTQSKGARGGGGRPAKVVMRGVDAKQHRERADAEARTMLAEAESALEELHVPLVPPPTLSIGAPGGARAARDAAKDTAVLRWVLLWRWEKPPNAAAAAGGGGPRSATLPQHRASIVRKKKQASISDPRDCDFDGEVGRK